MSFEPNLKIQSDGFVPESLEWCEFNYVPKVDKFISCGDFGKMDGMDGSCHWCENMTPYQFMMCCDEHWIKSSTNGHRRVNSPIPTREEAILEIQRFKQQRLEQHIKNCGGFQNGHGNDCICGGNCNCNNSQSF